MTLSLEIHPSQPEEAPLLTRWISDPAILKWFPMSNGREIEDAVRIWMGYARMGASFTAYDHGQPVGMAVLYLHAYQKLAHHCLFAIIVDAPYRSRGVGRALIEHFEKVAREVFHIEFLSLEVYEGNPAIRLYERLGFVQFGTHPRFIKDEGVYIQKILMQKQLVPSGEAKADHPKGALDGRS